MAPKRVQSSRPAPKGGASAAGYLSSAYGALTSAENASVVRSVAIFGVAVAFFSSSWSEYLLPDSDAGCKFAGGRACGRQIDVTKEGGRMLSR
ncbi:TOM core complex subunit Tom6 [Drepanopeziza brunnea f. sp. 'multigermtubi' MB_m1]|uniref:TOM core complex subunit Tom6 n=1 Tax=Marssonina brunnea f. sp. multigermtubi (strain MB_m1) TaxID=1072389 RepID=K1Y8B6_MARBU|nr:TOM core complex subunit Tom6 [Drepanopeziza brunnea f. sp. 'multigermtubi' MB_m1]EKD21409.1 TOM core complex subunit Tom6 [Drepanopeziza brunnea f. sp. 'multigermtubi' MB_m1]